MVDLGADRALFSISVTSELTEVNPQMLRVYEQKGLVAPYRTEGGTRRYSGQDVDRIREITTLLAAGLNLAGVEQVLHLRSENDRLQGEIDRLRTRARRSAARGRAEPGG
ncbi:MerR family transcriptional regulator [Nocardioides donggukensis]|uniref:MerR family transcriptional regulator n=1 Tax=Nocardioides donggukensis TaxID=2774019 RepID=A0A927K5C5_9ACTN|nr:MerR family transcriptional regulator [Nocardioides donggukensis]MBD8870201.1 MerR family transcriptional regulator [Nocardioides donggukensis]